MVIVQCDGSDDDDCSKVIMLWVKSKIKNVGIILSVPILLICDLSSDSFVVIVIATVAAIISWIIVNSYCSPFFFNFIFVLCMFSCTCMYQCVYLYVYEYA